MAAAHGQGEVPPAVTRYVAAITTGACLALGASLVAVGSDTIRGGPFALGGLHLVAAALLAALFGLFHRFPFTFYWREHRLVVSLDELVILLGVMIVPAPLLVVIAGVVNAGMQLWSGPSAIIKRLFNVSQYIFATSAAVATFLAMTVLGAPALPSAVVAALTFGLAVNLLLSGVFASLSNVNVLSVFRERFLVQGTAAAVVGISGGIALLALWTLHPLATFASLPFAYLVRRYWQLYAVADRELEVHRKLANVTHDLVGSSHVDAVAERVVAECERLLDCGRAEIVVDAPGAQLTMGRNYGSGPQRQAPSLVEPLPAHGGGTLGRIEVWPRLGKEAFKEQERALLRTIAGQAASAMENARAIADANEARERLDTYLSTAQDAVLLVDPQGRLQYANPAARRLFAPDGDDAPATDWTASALFDDPRLALTDGQVPTEPLLVETQARTRRGDRTFLAEAHVGPVYETGRLTGLLMVVRDVTERKRLEDETTRQREALAQNEKLSALGTLVAGVAHEINNPLTYMRGNLQLAAEMLEMRLADADLGAMDRQMMQDLNESIKVSLEGVTRITGIASSLKNVAKKGTGQSRPEDLNRLVHEVLSVVRTNVPRNVRLETDLAPDLPHVHVQAPEIHQILLNLVKNAVEALGSREDGLVRVASRADEENVHLTVADNGSGIPAEVQRSLFSPFFTTKENGTGLGLSISRGIAQKHGGELSLVSEEGEGTIFTLTLPRHGPAQQPDDHAEDAPAADAVQ